MTVQAVATAKRDWGELGPAMKALRNDRHRAFVDFYLIETLSNGNKRNYGAQARAARKAGFGGPNTPAHSYAQIGWELMKDGRIVAAIAEESRKLLRAGAPEAVKAVHAGVRNPGHKDHARFVAMVLDRADPVESRQLVEVTHRTIDPDQEALEELRAARALGASREKLIELFGGNYLPRLERLEAADTAKRADAAKIIDAEAIEVP
jgi:hypothetical protein